MKNFKLLVLIITLFCFTFMSSINCLACDLTLNAKEENYLFYYDSIENSCQGNEYENANCTKYLIRYDGLTPKIEKIIKFIGEEDPVPGKIALEKAGILTTGAAVLGTGIYFAPITTILTTLGLVFGTSAVCLVHNKIIKPTDKILDFIFKPFTKVVDFFVGDDSDPNQDVGTIGNAIITLCGNHSSPNKNEGLLEGIRKLVFGEKISNIQKTNEQIAYKELYDEFRKQVKERKFEKNDNNILIFCMDSTDVNNIKHNLKFDRTHINIGKYPNKTEDYFKEWL